MIEHSYELRLIELATEIVSAYVAHNAVPASEVPLLMKTVHSALDRMQSGQVAEPVVEQQPPAISIRKSVTDDYIVCLEDGRKFKSLKRHLQSAYGLSPEQYRTKWALPRDYPMVAPSYATKRSELARKIGLGRKIDG